MKIKNEKIRAKQLMLAGKMEEYVLALKNISILKIA